MLVFISWNGERSHAIAKALHEWLPNVIQSVRTFYSPRIEKGTTGLEKIREALEASSFGILCLTPENRNSNWIHFEAGALSKLKSDARLWTVLYDLKPTDIEAPLSQFQHTATTKDEVFAMLESINQHTAGALDPERLKANFEMWWWKLEADLNKVAEILVEEVLGAADDNDIRSERALIEEILTIVRSETSQRQRSVFDLLHVRHPSLNRPSWIRRGTVIFKGENRELAAERAKEELAKLIEFVPHRSRVDTADDSARLNFFFDPACSMDIFDNAVSLIQQYGHKISGWTFDPAIEPTS